MHKWMKKYEELLEDIETDYATVKAYINQFMPTKMYRYRCFDKYYESNIMQGQVYLSFPDAYNDPFDSAVKIDRKEFYRKTLGNKMANQYENLLKRDSLIRENQNKIYESTVKNFKRYVKVACFTESVDNMLMWSHYAKNHSGFCIEYDTKKSELFRMLALPVIYKSTRYDATRCLITRSSNIACNPVIYKSDKWAYEKEWRMFGTIETFKNEIDFLDLRGAISAIYLGACVNKEENEDKIQEIKEWAKIEKIEVRQMRLDNDTYKLLYS